MNLKHTMTSREIAELTGKRHDNVRRDIKAMAEELSLKIEEKPESSNGQTTQARTERHREDA